jgi:hypothetical protein
MTLDGGCDAIDVEAMRAADAFAEFVKFINDGVT